MDDRDQKVREHAYRIWEDEGRPEGSHEEHWRRAEEHDSSTGETDAGQETDENWRVEAGLAEEKPGSDFTPAVLPPD